MPNPFFSARIPQELNKRIEEYIAETGKSKTEILINALAAYLDFPVAIASPQKSEVTQEMFTALVEELASLRDRVTVLEKSAKVSEKLENSSKNSTDNKYDINVITNKFTVIGNDNKDVKIKLTKEEEEAVISIARKMYDQGSPLKAIADYLNKEGYPTKRGAKWQGPQVKRILDK